MLDLESYLKEKKRLEEEPQIQGVQLMDDEDYELGDYLFDDESDFLDDSPLYTPGCSTLLDHLDEDDDDFIDDYELLDDF